MAPNATDRHEDSSSMLGSGLSTDKPVPAESIRVEDKVYSAHALSDMHPGGPVFMKAFAGRDATTAFLSYHRRKFPHSRVQSALEYVDPSVMVDPEISADYLDLCERVEKVLPRAKSFAPWSYYIKASILMAVTVGVEMYMHFTGVYRWYLCMFVGWCFALIGLNIQHDANHGALSKRSWVNRVWGASINWIGGSSISWIHQHVVQHHLFTNDVKLDPDIEGRAVVRLNPLRPILKYHFMQHVYFFLIIFLYGFSVVFHSFSTIVEGANYTPISPLLKWHRVFEASMSLLYFFRWIVLPQIIAPGISTALNIFPMLMVTGWWLSFFFTISHNFEGVKQVDLTKEQSKSFLYNQVVTSSNVGGKFLCFMNGGLNYQIEHHLFPRMHHGHYPIVSPVVREFCEERGFPYHHFPTLRENVTACVNHLFSMGTEDVPKSAKHIAEVAKASSS